MIYRVFSVFDSKVAHFGVPFTDIKDEGAIRNFGDAVRDGSNRNNMWHNHPEDYSLWFVGEFDTEKGALHGVMPINLINASAIATLSGPPQMELFEKKSDKEPVN